MPLRIAQIAPLWNPVPPSWYGGIERMVHFLSEGLIKRGHEVHLFASGDSRTSATLHSVCEKNLAALMTEGKAFLHENYAIENISSAIRFSGSFDVIHSHMGSIGLPWDAFSSCKCIHTFRTSITHDDIWMLRKHPDAHITLLSGSQLAAVPDDLRRRIHVIHNGIIFEDYEVGNSPGTYLAFLGRMSPNKNPVGAIKLARELKMRLVLAGQPCNPVEEVYFNEQVKPLIDGEQVKFIGYVDHQEKQALLRNAAAFIFPIVWDEAFGSVMIEAMACGTPVLALKRGSVEEVVDQGITGYHADSIEELAGFVPQALKLNRKTVRDHAITRFSHEQMIEQYLQLYRNCVGD